MALDVENDIEAFIRNQKQKLAQERQDLNQDEPSHHERKTWDRPPAHSKPQVKVDEQVGRPPTEETGLLIGRNSVEGRRKKLQEERQREYNDLINKNPNPQGPRRLPTPKGRSLPVGTGQDQMTERRRGLREERTREYNNMLAKSPKPIRHPPTPDDSGLPLGQDNKQRQQLEEERNKEYRELMEKPKQLQVRFSEDLDYKPYISDQRQFKNELCNGLYERSPNYIRQDQNQMHNGFDSGVRSQHISRVGNSTVKDNSSEYLQKGLQGPRKENLPPKPATPETFLNKLGSHESQRKKLEEERKREYNDLLSRKAGRGERLPPREGETLAVPGLVDRQKDETRKSWEDEIFEDFLRHRYAKKKRRKQKKGQRQDSFVDSKPYSQEKIKQRNEEYNEFLRQKERAKGGSNPPSSEKHGNRSADGHGRHQARERKQERNKECREVMRVMNMSDDEGSDEPDIKPYSRVSDIRQEDDWLKEGPPGAPRRGWTTPTYDEILQKKQQEENRYRRYDDPELPRPGGNPYRPEGFDERRGVLNDDDWLRPQQMKQDLYNALNNMRDSLATVARATPPSGQTGEDEEEPPHQQNKAQLSPRRLLPEPVGKPRATLLIDPKTVGHEETSSAKRRKKDAYRHELEQQIQEHKDAIKWEKTGDWRVSATGFLDPEKHPDRLRGLPANDSSHHLNSNGRAHSEAPPHQPGGRDPRLDYLSPRSKAAYLGNNNINPYLGALDSLSSRTDAMLGRRGDVGLGSTGGGGGILDRGWEGLYDRPRPSVKPIAPSGYDNSSYLTDLPSGYNAVNDAYHLYGMRNPLDTYNDQAGPSIPYDSAPAAGKVRFEEPSKSPRKGDQPHHVLPFPVGDDKTGKTRHKQDVQSYQAELQKQIEEQRMKKKREKEEQERLDRKWEEENKNYNPFGRGGGGAPLKDTTGNTLADLRQLRIGPESGGVKQSPRGPPQPASPRMVANSPPPVSGDGTYARGGHGIFGVPKTYEEKSASDRYKDELRQQIEDKRRREAEEKEKLLAEEEKENRRLQEQQQRIQQEFEAEQRKKIEKEEEARKRNEELQKITEEKKRAAEHQRKEAEERRLEELRARQEEERRQREQERQQQEEEDIPLDTAVRTLLQAEQRGKSPVVPALRTKAAASPTPGRTQPSPAPSQQDHRPPRANSADVLNQLATMRRQLQSERARVENALDRQKNDYEVFDPRLVVQRPPAAPRRDHDAEIFEGARNRAPVSVRRPPPDSANPDIVNEFNYLKHQGSSESRREVRESYPETPHSSNDLEAQQRALIQKQEHNLRRQPLKSVYEQALPNMAPRDLGREESPQVLQSDSAFIDFKQVGTFPEDFEDLPRRNTPARQRRRDNSSSSPRYNPDNYSVRSNPMGSNVSLDVDRISKKNEDRLKRLKDITGDDVSLADPDDVLDRFMSRQKHNRPPSGQTLKDDTWMRPDSRF